MNSQFEVSGQILVHFSLLSLMAVGGGVVALAPEMMRFVTETHPWMTLADFVEIFTLAQIAPGPNILFATLVGLRAAGLLGAVVATVALVVPPALLTLASLHYGARSRGKAWGERVRTTVLPLSVGMVAATSWALGSMALHGLAHATFFAVAVAVLHFTRLNPLWLIAAAAGLGMAGIL